MNASNPQKTPLHDAHQAAGSKIVDFAGWLLPVRYSSVVEEHNAVRNSAGLFDVSHMGEIEILGPEALEFIQYITCNDASKLYDGKAQYSAFINQEGGVIDDIIVYRLSEQRYLLCVNASNVEKDYAWLLENKRGDIQIVNRSAEFGQIAIQGPRAIAILQQLTPETNLEEIAYFHCAEVVVAGREVLAARTGYTGEDGFELFINSEQTPEIWSALLEVGQAQGLQPCGLGARDSLRLEACFPLHGHELREDVSAIESGLGWIVKLKKGEFLGKAALENHKLHGAPRTLVGFHVLDKGIVREETELLNEAGEAIGSVCSGTKTPTLNVALGLALLDSAYKEIGTKFLANVRGRKLVCEVVKTPFYKRQ